MCGTLLPDAPAFLDELVDAVRAQPRRPARSRCVGGGSWSTATSHVMSCVPRSSSGAPPRSWPRYVRSHSVHGRVAIDAVVSRVVEHDDARPQRAARRAPIGRRPSAPGRARRRARRAPVASPGTSTSTSASSVEPDPHLEPAAVSPLEEVDRQVVEQLVGEHDDGTVEDAAARARLTTIGPVGRPRRPDVVVLVVGAVGRERERGILEREVLALPRRAAPPTARRARSAAPARTPGAAASTATRERARAGARLDHDERVGLTHARATTRRARAR